MLIKGLENMRLLNNPEIKEPKTKDEKKLKEASEDFEAIFVKMMLDSMDKTIDRKDSLINGGEAEEMFHDMLNNEWAKNMSKSQSLGIAEMLYKQLSERLKEK